MRKLRLRKFLNQVTEMGRSSLRADSKVLMSICPSARGSPAKPFLRGKNEMCFQDPSNFNLSLIHI